MGFTAGTELACRICGTGVIVVRPPEEEITLTCGGSPMALSEGELPDAPHPEPRQAGAVMGKRYEDPPSGLEVLCTSSGRDVLEADERELVMKEPKPVPSSD